jgi:hypothetical protein
VDWSEPVSVRLNLGENRVAVTVQAPNGAAVRTYMITAYVLTGKALYQCATTVAVQVSS